jgi:hypothetical protein
VPYASEVTAFVEKGQAEEGHRGERPTSSCSLAQRRGAAPGKVTFKTGTGLSDSLDAIAFELSDASNAWQLELGRDTYVEYVVVWSESISLSAGFFTVHNTTRTTG